MARALKLNDDTVPMIAKESGLSPNIFQEYLAEAVQRGESTYVVLDYPHPSGLIDKCFLAVEQFFLEDFRFTQPESPLFFRDVVRVQ